MDNLATWIELGLAVIVILAGQAVLWVRFKTLMEQDMSNCKAEIKRHDRCLTTLKAQVITVKQHDKIQADCRQGIYTDIDNIKQVLGELRDDVKNNDQKLDAINLSLVELRGDLKVMGAVQ